MPPGLLSSALPELSRLLAEQAADPVGLLRTAADHIAGHGDGVCVISLLAAPDEHAALVVGHPDPEARSALAALVAGAPTTELANDVLASGRPQVATVEEPAELRSWLPERAWPYLERFPLTSLLYVPVRVRGESRGLVALARGPGDAAFTDGEIAVLQDAADRIGLAADNAQLLARTQRKLVELTHATREARAEHVRYSALFRSNPVPMYAWRREGDELRLVDANDVAYAQTGGAIAGLLGRTEQEVHGDQPELLVDFRTIFADHRPIHRSMDFELRGHVRHLMVTFVYVPDDTVIVHTEDVTELRRSRAAYQELVEQLPAILYETGSDAGAPYQFVSPQIEAVLGWTPAEWTGEATWLDAVHPDDRTLLLEARRRCLDDGEPVSLEYRMLCRNGETVWVRDEAVLRASAGTGPQRLRGFLSDVTERKQFESRLQYLADHDALTGLWNRRRFVDELGREIALAAREGRPSSLLLLDIDNFKQINDSLGHLAGDDVLRSLTGLLRDRLRRSDVLGRLGGDEFAILLPDTDPTSAAGLAETLRAAVADDVHDAADQAVRATISIGLADAASAGATAAGVIAAADLALYAAKAGGRDSVVPYDPRFRVELTSARLWQQRLTEALASDRFVLEAQPIRSLATGDVTQHELLLRLPADDGTLVAPGKFLGYAERFDLIQPIDRWVVQRAFRLVAEHRDAGERLVVSVNLSGKSVGDPRLVALIADQLTTTGVDPSCLVFEVTETSAIADMAAARVFATALHDLGCRLALDDFGSGFSSFYYVKHMPFDYLKIDGEFVRQLTADPFDQAVVRAIVAVAGSVGRETVAEFVEDEGTLQLLRELGVTYVQGFHVGRPAPLRGSTSPA